MNRALRGETLWDARQAAFAIGFRVAVAAASVVTTILRDREPSRPVCRRCEVNPALWSVDIGGVTYALCEGCQRKVA